MKKFRTILILLMGSAAIDAIAQDPVFSQYYSSSLYLNPALAGIEKQATVSANYRSQWNKLVLPFNTFQLSFVQPVYQRGARKKHMGGVGLSVLNDTAGLSHEYSSQGISVSGAYNLYFGHSDSHTLTFAVQAGASQQKISLDNLRWTSQYGTDNGYDPNMPGESAFSNTRVFQPVLGSGLMWSFSPSRSAPTYYQGFALSNILPTQSYFTGTVGNAFPTFKAHGGINIPFSSSFELSPNYLIQRQGSNQQVNGGMYAGYSIANTTFGDVKFLLGTWYRFGDALIVSGGIATKKLSVAFSFDNNISSMGRSFGNANAHELSMSYRLANRNSFKRISSPLI